MYERAFRAAPVDVEMLDVYMLFWLVLLVMPGLSRCWRVVEWKRVLPVSCYGS
ncbi:hypothetical protein Pyrfu_0584 [Pyrolobus fumarii 1A]|uniref:Uncharacterized protein n=1 Tax=Pyrolobus fumarii (strain DSM 11204 / 1A) TaxID=694429 RepID=G0EH04_PYRF1|nr:hypothetical protein Pyrfu_0584 [Pyrolobus fumarii 1A]